MARFQKAIRATKTPRDQVENFLTSGYVPQPKQLLFHATCRECDRPEGPTEVAFGGARGPGKTHATVTQIALDDCQRFDGLKCLLLRRVGRAIYESFEDLRQKCLSHIPHKYNRSSGTLTFPNGSRIILGHFKDERDIDNYLGLEYDVIGIEEATTLTSSKYKAIRTCCRTSKPNWRPRVYSNANPGGVGHAWFKKRFVMASPGGRAVFIPATYRDNVFLDATYVESLDDLTGWLKRAWRDGDWDISAGQYFSTFSRSVHVVDPRPVEEWEEVWLAMDVGWVHPTAVILFKRDLEGGIYVVDEYQASRRLPEANSNLIREMLSRWDIREERISFVVGQDAFAKDCEGRSISDSYEELGWRLERANMARIGGAMEILRLLGDADAGIQSSLRIYSTCVGLIETLPRLEHDPHRPDDVLKCDVNDDGEGGDDLYDAFRYGVMWTADTVSLQYEPLLIPR